MFKQKLSLYNINTVIQDFFIVGDENIIIYGSNVPEFAKQNDLIWIHPRKKFKDIIDSTSSIIIMIQQKIFNSNSEYFLTKKDLGKTFLVTKNPKLTFIKIYQYLYGKKYVTYKNIYVGQNCYISQNCQIGQNVILRGNNFIYNNCKLGNNVIIQAGAVIGCDGFGYAKDQNGVNYRFPHNSGVIIYDNVQIGANTCIDSGALIPTIIKEGVKIDNLVHIAHNVQIGNNCVITASVNISGNVKIGENVYIGVGSSIKNGLTIGDNAYICMGSIVTNSVKQGQRVIGYPAVSSYNFANQRYFINKNIRKRK